MFFRVFLLVIILTQVSPTYIAEQDYYKHYDEYDDYEYDDATPVIKDKPTGGPTSEATSKKETSNETHDTRTKKRAEKVLNKNFESKKIVSSTDSDDELTYVLTEEPDIKLPAAGYEVTEIVDDIPNPVTFKPIVTNFTIKLPLNNATGINNGQNNKGNAPRKNSISIFHVNAEFDDDKDKKPVIQNINVNKVPFGLFKVKDHIDKVKEDVLNYVHSTEGYDGPHEGHYLPNILSAPKHFLQMIREKGSAFYHKWF